MLKKLRPEGGIQGNLVVKQGEVLSIVTGFLCKATQYHKHFVDTNCDSMSFMYHTRRTLMKMVTVDQSLVYKKEKHVMHSRDWPWVTTFRLV